MGHCPGFGQDRVNFHQNPGRGTARWADPTPPGKTEPGIPYHVPSRWVPVRGAAPWDLTRGSGARGTGPVRESGCLGCAIRVVFSPYLYRYCSCSLLFAVLLNFSYPYPPVFCLFISILLRTLAGGGSATWHFCCRWQPKPKHLIVAQRGAGKTAGLSSGC